MDLCITEKKTVHYNGGCLLRVVKSPVPSPEESGFEMELHFGRALG